MKMLLPDNPIYIALSGPAGSGKTATANAIVPKSSIGAYGNLEDISKTRLLVNSTAYPSMIWDHLFFAMPLYEMLEAKNLIGIDRKDRAFYMLHRILNDLMMERIPYDDLIELVYDIYSLPVDSNGSKPRSFLQTAGDLCRKHEKDCFADSIKYKVLSRYRNEFIEYDRQDLDPPIYFAVISDLRMLNEAEMIKNQPNHFMFKFTARPEVLASRIFERDGVELSDTQSSHSSENSFNDMPDDWFDLIIDTSDLTVVDQGKMVYNYILANCQLKASI